MSNALFPDVVGDSYSRRAAYRNSAIVLGDQNTVYFRKWVRPRYTFALGWGLLSKVERQGFDDFVHSMAGAFTEFDFFDWRSSDWPYVPMDLPDGSTSTFTVPGKATSQQHFYLDGETEVLGDVSSGTGDNGEDEVIFPSPPAAGHLLSCRFVGRRRFTVRSTSFAPFTELPEPVDYYSWNTTLMEKK